MRRVIQFVRDKLEEQDCIIVRLRDVIRAYNDILQETGESAYSYKTDRALLAHIQPSLSQSQIYLRVASRKEGAYFCTISKFDELSRPSEELPPYPHPQQLRELLKPLREYISSRQEEILNGEWQLFEFIRKCPPLVWSFFVLYIGNVQLLRTGRAEARIHNSNAIEEWPLNPRRCPEDISVRSYHEFCFAARIYYSIERDVFMMSNNTIRGPITILLSLCGLPSATVSFISILNRLGCAVSYAKVNEWRAESIRRRQEAGPFNELLPKAFASVAIDNINIRSSHSMSVHGSSYNGFDGLAVQGVNSVPSFDFSAYLDALPAQDKLPRYYEYQSRTQFIEENFPKVGSDPDVVGFKYFAVGTAIASCKSLATEDFRLQKSFRRALMEGLEGRSGGRANIEYVDIRKCCATDVFEIERILQMVEEKFNPPGSSKIVMVAVVGDQPIFKMLFQIWMASYVKRQRRALWLVPDPGAFHIDKQAIIPAVKKYLWGSGIEELLRFSGLSPKHQDNFLQLPHYRKNRRFLSQITCAYLIRIGKTLSEMNPSFATQLQMHIDRETTWNELSRSEREIIANQKSFATEIRSILPPHCRLATARTLHPSVIIIGKLISEHVAALGTESRNMKVFGEIQVLDTLVPWCGYNITLRKGQTSIVDKFYDVFLGVIHGTNKHFYQENMLFYSVVRKCISKAAYDVLYEHGHFVVNLNRRATDTNLGLDEAMETGIIKETKRWKSNNEKAIQESRQLTMMVSRASRAAEQQLRTSRHHQVVNEEVGEQNETRKAKTKVDREKKTAMNVFKMVEYLNERKYLGVEHTRSAFLVNPLPQPAIAIDDETFTKQFIDADAKGRFAASLHIGAKLYPIFSECRITEEERKVYFGGKPFNQILDRWNRNWLFRSLADADANRSVVQAMQRREREESLKLFRIYRKRRERIRTVLASISKEFYACTKSGSSHAVRLRDVQLLHDIVEKKAHVVSPKAFVYRKAVVSDEPHYIRNSFVESLQASMRASKLMDERDCFFYNSSVLSSKPSINVIHVDCSKDAVLEPLLTVLQRTIGEACDDKPQRFMKPLIESPQYAELKDIHVHVDYQPLEPVLSPYGSADHPPTRFRHITEETDSSHLKDEHLQRVGLSSKFSYSWKRMFENASNKHFLTSIHALKCAKFAVLRSEKSNQESHITRSSRNACTSDHESFIVSKPPLTVFLHGVAVVFENKALLSPLEDLVMGRIGDFVLIRSRSSAGNCDSDLPSLNSLFKGANPENERPFIEGDALQEEYGVYGPECCWYVSKAGIKRYPSGDVFEPLSVVRIPQVITNISLQRAIEMSEIPTSATVFCTTSTVGARILLVCEQYESPIVALFADISCNHRVLFSVNESLVDMTSLKNVLEKNSISTDDIGLLYCLSGCEHVPHTKGVPQRTYIDAYFKHLSSISPLSNPRLPEEVASNNLGGEDWAGCEKLVAAAFLLSSKKRISALHRGTNTIESAIGKAEFALTVRRRLADVFSAESLVQMPEQKDIELQVRRSAFWLHTWRRASLSDCANMASKSAWIAEQTSYSLERFGYTCDGGVIFEMEDERNRRAKLLEDPVIRVCRCKSKQPCRNKQCGCIVREVSCIFCDCAPSCRNTGIKLGHGQTLEIQSEGDTVSANTMRLDLEPSVEENQQLNEMKREESSDDDSGEFQEEFDF